MEPPRFKRSADVLRKAVASVGPGRSLIADQAGEFLFIDYNREDGSDEIPVNLGRLAHTLHCRVDLVRRIEGESRLLPLRSGFAILVDLRKSYPRRRVSIAHELAHTLFYDVDRQNHRIIPPSSEEEGFCFDVGRRLLAPRHLLKQAGFYRKTDTGKIFRELRSKFRLTRPVAARTLLADSSLISGVAGIWRMAERDWVLDRDSVVTSPILDSTEALSLLNVLERMIKGNTMRASSPNVVLESQVGDEPSTKEIFGLAGEPTHSLLGRGT